MGTWSMNAKLGSILVLLGAVAAAIGFAGLYNIGTVTDQLTRITERVAIRALLAVEIESGVRFMTVHLKDHLLSQFPEKMSALSKAMDQEEALIEKQFTQFLKLADPDATKKVEGYRETFRIWRSVTKLIRDHSLHGNKPEALRISLEEGEPLRRRVVAEGAELVKINRIKMDVAAALAKQTSQSSRIVILSVTVAGIAISMGLAFLVLGSINRAVDRVIVELAVNSDQVTVAARQIASSSEELSQAATEQAASLEQTAASVEQMSSMIQANAVNARRATTLAESSRDRAQSGQRVAQEMEVAIEEIHISNTEIMNSVKESNRKISEIVRMIGEISDKTKVINEIVFQTNLLSFNASVEAARAGDHGRGFAVVAEEVGILAKTSGAAADEIAEMLDISILKVTEIVRETTSNVQTLVEAGRAKVELGTRTAKDCSSLLTEIVGHVAEVAQISHEISNASQEQSVGVQEINKAMSQLDLVTQTNAATSEESASAAEELSAQADSMKSTVLKLTSTIKGAKG